MAASAGLQDPELPDELAEPEVFLPNTDEASVAEEEPPDDEDTDYEYVDEDGNPLSPEEVAAYEQTDDNKDADDNAWEEVGDEDTPQAA
jgi:hypothetical protein